MGFTLGGSKYLILRRSLPSHYQDYLLLEVHRNWRHKSFFKQVRLKAAMRWDQPAWPPLLLVTYRCHFAWSSRAKPRLILQGYDPPTLRVQTVAYKYNSSGEGTLRATTINSLNCLHRFDTKPPMLFPVLTLVLRRAVLHQLALATNLSTYYRTPGVRAPFPTRGRALATFPNRRAL